MIRKQYLLALRVLTPRILFVSLSALGVVLVFLIPPMQVADEQWHFLRAYQIQEGRFLSEKRGPFTGAVLPASLGELADNFMVGVMGNTNGKLTKNHFSKAWLIRLEPTVRSFLPFSGPSQYCPLAYFPQSASIRLASFFSDRPIVLFYAGRLGNYLIATLLLYFAVVMTPIHPFLITALAFIPMNVYQRASVAPDALIAALSLLALSLFACVSFDKKKNVAVFLGGCFVLLALAPLKQVYVPFLLLLFWARKSVPARVYWGGVVGTILLSAYANLAWLSAIRPTFSPLVRDAIPEQQMRFFLAHPDAGIWAVLNYYRGFWFEEIRMIVGQLGWLETYLWKWHWTGYCAFLLYCALSECALLSWTHFQRAALFAIGVGGFLLTAFAVYIAATPVGASNLMGVQGRYLIPFFYCLVLAVGGWRGGTSESFRPLNFVVQGVSLAALFSIIASRYYR